jgi:hypothetical protein
MTNIEGMHSYFWLTSSRLKESVGEDVPYTTQALKQDLLRLQTAWDDCQASRARDATYGYLSASKPSARAVYCSGAGRRGRRG